MPPVDWTSLQRELILSKMVHKNVKDWTSRGRASPLKNFVEYPLKPNLEILDISTALLFLPWAIFSSVSSYY